MSGACANAQRRRTGWRVPVHDLGLVEAEPERIRSSREADNEFPVGDVVGLDRESRHLFGREMLLEVETHASVLDPNVEALVVNVQRDRARPVDSGSAFDTVLEGNDMRIVHRHAFSLNPGSGSMPRPRPGLHVGGVDRTKPRLA